MSNTQFTFGIFALTKLNSRTCTIGINESSEGNENPYKEGNGLIDKTETNETTITIPAYAKDEASGKLYKVTETNIYCFRNCKSITSITLPDTLIKIGYDCFFYTSIQKLIIRSSVEILDRASFSHMLKCSEIIFQPGSKIEFLPWSTFSRIDKSTTLVLPPSIKKLEKPFFDALSLQTIYYCGSHDLSSMDGNWPEISVKIFVTDAYPSSSFAGKNVEVDTENVCLPYIYYQTNTCKQIKKFNYLQISHSYCYIFLILS